MASHARRARLAARARAGLAALALALACAPSSGPPQRIVLIVVDTLRRDHLSCYGSENPTPVIDALAARGQRFTNVFASFHQTSMSMGALFTGRTPSIEFLPPEKTLFWNSQTWCGMSRFSGPRHGEGEQEDCIPESVPTLAERLKQAGYATLGVTSNQFLYEPGGYARGFDTWVEVGERPGPESFARLGLVRPAESRYWVPVNTAVSDVVARRESDRFFLYVHYMDVHDYGDRRVSYVEAVRTVDRAIGILLDGLDRAGLLEGAVVLVTADHGERLREKHAVPGRDGHVGNPTFLEHLRIPLVVAPAVGGDPTRFLRTEAVHDLILRIAGVGVLPADDLAEGELFLSEMFFQTYLDGRFKTSIRREDGAPLLFDLESDPAEARDVSARHPDVVARHRARIAELSRELSARRAVLEKLSPEDRERLRALGYLDELLEGGP